MQNLKKVQTCADALKSELPQGFSPVFGIALGTGLGNLTENAEIVASVPYANLPDFPLSTVASHQGVFEAGYVAGVPVLLQKGRCHLYEGRTPEEIVMGVRVMGLLGVRGFIATNAAGSLNPRFPAGSLMLIDDHINFSGQSPLSGMNEEALGVRFPDMSLVYDPVFIAHVEKAALEIGQRLEKGVYLCTPGPQLETRAETRAFRLLGADAVGMSTVLEVIAARHMGLKVLGIACISNQNLPDCMGETTLDEIVLVAQSAGKKLAALLEKSLPALAAAL